MNVFISSTREDLKSYREKALETVSNYQCHMQSLEHFNVDSDESGELIAQEIEECDLFIGIYAHRYGPVPLNEKKSIIRLEFELAKQLEKDCLCFIIDDDFPWPPRFMGWSQAWELDSFLTLVKKTITPVSFTTPTDFGIKLAMGLSQFQHKREHPDKEADSMEAILVPSPPEAFFYPLTAPIGNLINWEAEKARLSHWWYNVSETLMVLEIPKSQKQLEVTRHWLQESILEKKQKIEGVFCWSFNNEPFDFFVAKLYQYLFGTSLDIESGVPTASMQKLCSMLEKKHFLLILEDFEQAQHPQAIRFIESLLNAQSQILVTTSFTPSALEILKGVEHHSLRDRATVEQIL